MMKWNIETKDNKAHVTLIVEHVKNHRRWTNTLYTSQDAREYLKEQKIVVDKLIQDCEVCNYQRESNLTGTWVFSLPVKPEPKKTFEPHEKKEKVLKTTNKKTFKPLEKKENVLKMTNKKTIKK